ncbi:MAG: hypothetical protein KDK99_05190 [Verrucomicrobiales bacterium]|nr:hypothetical protein [Verrucomicrobiales bacterium]
MIRTFDAPWSRTLKWISLLATVAVLAVSIWLPAPETVAWLWWPVRLFGPVLVSGCALFTIRGYTLVEGELRVQRLFWSTRVPLKNLRAVEFRPGPFGWAIRVLGNGGFFSFSGLFYQSGLSLFRAMATRVGDAIILRFTDRLPLVLTPADPQAFAEAVRQEASQTGAPSPSAD